MLLTTYLHLTVTLRMRGAMPLFSLRFLTRCLDAGTIVFMSALKTSDVGLAAEKLCHEFRSVSA
jgi:hypothetical protein